MVQDEQPSKAPAASADAVDELNTRYYQEHPYPPLPPMLSRCEDPTMGAALLNQALGDFAHTTIPEDARIWVAGCGTYQAVDTALRFPRARVLGSDISSSSLQITERVARDVEVTDLLLRQESILGAAHREEFDYILSTGVIHHTADPEAALRRLAAALKPSGVLELMVYHQQHRALVGSLQRAVRLLSGAPEIDYRGELTILRRLIDAAPSAPRSEMDALLRGFRGAPTARLADDLLQPVEHTFTVATLRDLAARAGLELAAPRIERGLSAEEGCTYRALIDDPELSARLDALPDDRRWEVSSLLLHERSPLLWFYLKRPLAGRKRRPSGEIDEAFLDARFAPIRSTQRCHVLDAGSYRPVGRALPYPLEPPVAAARALLERALPERTPREIFREMGSAPSPHAVYHTRIWLTTPAFPFLRATRAC